MTPLNKTCKGRRLREALDVCRSLNYLRLDDLKPERLWTIENILHTIKLTVLLDSDVYNH